MLLFIIPIKSKKVTGSWQYFERLYHRTLLSIANQTSPNFRIISVCHEKPNVNFDDSRLEYLFVDFPPPELIGNKEHDINLKEADKANKIIAGAKHAEQYNPDYIMVVDADDCISNRITTYVDEHMNETTSGWYFKKGFFYKEGSKFITLNKNNFNTLCGTCTIIKPELLSGMFTNNPNIHYNHNVVTFENDKKLIPFPIPASIYSMANGENHYMSTDMIKNLNKTNILSLNFIKSMIRKIKRYRLKLLTKKIKREFGLYDVK